MEDRVKAMRDQVSFDHIAVLPKEVSYDLNQIVKVIDGIGGRFGCSGCCSGKDILFKTEESFLNDMRRAFASDFLVTNQLDVKQLQDSLQLQK